VSGVACCICGFTAEPCLGWTTYPEGPVCPGCQDDNPRPFVRLDSLRIGDRFISMAGERWAGCAEGRVIGAGGTPPA